MDLVHHYSDLDVTELCSYLERPDDFNDKDLPSWQSSQLYSSTRQEKFVDEDLRQSSFRLFTKGKIFDHLEKIIEQKLNKNESDDYRYILRTNDITHIRYQTGGFFKKHKDYLSCTSNLLEEFTLLICVTPEHVFASEGGGDTTIFGYRQQRTFDTHTPGCGLVFRKDLEHQGNNVLKGEKHIVMANLWAIRKNQTEQVLLVTFPTTATDGDDTEKSEKEDSKKKSGSTTTTTSIQKAACAASSYALPAHLLTGMLQVHLEWANRKAQELGEELPPVVEYACTNFNFDSFGTVAKILKRAYVSEDALFRHADCLDYFGPFPMDYLLVELALEEKKSEADTKAPSTTSETNDSEGKSGKNEKNEQAYDDNLVIVCENEARTKAVMNVARLLNEPYVPFKMLFVEGVLETGGEMGLSLVDVAMNCGLCVVGEHHNILSWVPMAQTSDPAVWSLRELHEGRNFFKECFGSEEDHRWKNDRLQQQIGESAEVFFSDDSPAACGDMIPELLGEGLGLGLLFGFGSDPEKVTTAVESFLFGMRGSYYTGQNMIILPGNKEGAAPDFNDPEERRDKMTNNKKRRVSDDDKTQTAKPGTSDAITQPDQTPPFHRDKHGLTVFTHEEAERASDMISKLNLEERVKSALQQTRFDLPQQQGYVDAHFCNESVYGSVNILWVSGVLRLDTRSEDPVASDVDEKAAGSQAQEFTVWPSAEAKANDAGKRDDIQERIAAGELYDSS